MSLLLVTALTASAYMRTAADAHGIWVYGSSSVLAAGPNATNYAAPSERAMQVNSKLISPRRRIPKTGNVRRSRYAAATGLERRSACHEAFALMVDDPDAPGGTFTHWIVWNILAATHELPENLPKTAELPDGAAKAATISARSGAADRVLRREDHTAISFVCTRWTMRLSSNRARAAVNSSAPCKGHVLARGELIGRYGR